MIWDEFSSQFSFRDKEDGELSDEEQKRSWPENRPKHTRKRVHQAGKTFCRNSKQFLRACLKPQRIVNIRNKQRLPPQKHGCLAGKLSFLPQILRSASAVCINATAVCINATGVYISDTGVYRFRGTGYTFARTKSILSPFASVFLPLFGIRPLNPHE